MTMPREGWAHRAPRPWLLWVGAAAATVAMVGLGIFLYRIGNAIAEQFERAANHGQAVPDMSGGLPALLTAAASFLAMMLPQILNALTARNRERRDQIARGSAPPPFVQDTSLPPSPDGAPRPGDTP